MKNFESNHRMRDASDPRQASPSKQHPSPVLPPRKAGELDISTRAREAARIMEAVKKAPDVREDLVLKLRTAIESGNYQVKGSDVAEKLIKESMLGSII